MNKNEIINIINSLVKCVKNAGAYNAHLKSYTTQELRELAIYLDGHDDKYPRNIVRTLLRDILSTRRILMNQNFTWSKENKIRFLDVNEKLTQAIQYADEEASKIFADIDKKMKSNDPFLTDFEIEIIVEPFIKYDGDEDNDDYFAALLAHPQELYKPISYAFGRSEIYMDKSYNWNWEYFDGAFDNDYIGYAIHALLDTHIWSFQDIINIETVLTGINVMYENRKRI